LGGLHWKGATSAFSLVKELENERIKRKESMEPQTRHSAPPAKFRHLLRVTEANGRFPKRNTLVLLPGITHGVRVT